MVGQTAQGTAKRLYCMCGGFLTFDQSVFTHMQGMGTPVEVPTLMFLIEHRDGLLLFETGLHPALAVDPAGHWGARAAERRPRMRPEQSVERQLERIGVRADDVRYVVLSCLLPDHAGGMQALSRARFIVQFQEMQDAWWPDRRYIASYDFDELQPPRGFDYWQLHGEDLDVFGDGAVHVLSCPAHTRGEQALAVRLANTGTVVLPAGVIPQRANLERRVMTGTPRVAPETVWASMTRLQRIIEHEGAMPIFHHDPEQWKTLRMLPEFYD
jgi:glyoxylase-like metal-dependent hydrolase (beta-lactamase superfamily II)